MTCKLQRTLDHYQYTWSPFSHQKAITDNVKTRDCEDISCTAAAISNNQTGKTGEMLRLSLV